MSKEVKENVDKILFIGNGFDLSNHMKTSYKDYLDSLKIKDEMLEKIKLIYEFESILTILEKREFLKKRNEMCYTFEFNNRPIEIEPIENISRGYNTGRCVYYGCTEEISGKMSLYSFEKPENLFKSVERKYKVFFTYVTIYQMFIIDPNSIYMDIKCSESLKTYIKQNHYEEFLDTYTNIKAMVDREDISLFSIYLQILRKKTYKTSEFYEDVKELELAGENWIDIENILYENQFSFFRSSILTPKNLDKLDTCNKYKYNYLVEIFNKIYYDEISTKENRISLDDDFKKFKRSFAEYIKSCQNNLNDIEKSGIKIYLENIYNRFKFNKIYNFNYSNYINKIVKEIDSKILVDNIHGSVDNGDKIAFGTNHYLFKQDNEEHNKILKEKGYTDISTLNKEENYKLTKIYQVLELGDSRNSEILGKVSSLTMLGHSIGRQDFEYMHTIIMTNPKEIVLNVLYADNKDVKNRVALTDAVYEMLGKYEELHGDVTIHKMILENRIKFIDVAEFNEVNDPKTKTTSIATSGTITGTITVPENMIKPITLQGSITNPKISSGTIWINSN